MTNEFVEIVGAVASTVLGPHILKGKKEESTPVVEAPAFDPTNPAFAPEAAVVTNDGVCIVPGCNMPKLRAGSILTAPISNLCHKHHEEVENQNTNEKVENNMTKENVVVEAVVVEEAVVTEEKKGFFAKFKSVVTELTGKAKAKVEEVKAGTAKEGTDKGASKEGFVAKAKAFGKGFVDGAVGFVKEHAVKAFAGLAALTIAGTFTTGMTAAVLVALPLYAVGSFAVSYLVSKYKKEEFSSVDSAITAAGDAVLYGFFGAIAAYYVAQFAVIATASVFVYGYVAVSYIGYFIVA